MPDSEDIEMAAPLTPSPKAPQKSTAAPRSSASGPIVYGRRLRAKGPITQQTDDDGLKESASGEPTERPSADPVTQRLKDVELEMSLSNAVKAKVNAKRSKYSKVNTTNSISVASTSNGGDSSVKRVSTFMPGPGRSSRGLKMRTSSLLVGDKEKGLKTLKRRIKPSETEIQDAQDASEVLEQLESADDIPPHSSCASSGKAREAKPIDALSETVPSAEELLLLAGFKDDDTLPNFEEDVSPKDVAETTGKIEDAK